MHDHYNTMDLFQTFTLIYLVGYPLDQVFGNDNYDLWLWGDRSDFFVMDISGHLAFAVFGFIPSLQASFEGLFLHLLNLVEFQNLFDGALNLCIMPCGLTRIDC